MTGPRTTVVVPTLGRRPEYLGQSLRSIRAAGEAYVLMVAPAAFDASPLIAEGLVDEKIDETGRSLAAAINQAFAAVPESTEFLAWLGDDDLLRPGSLTITSGFLATHPRSSAVYGGCAYIDEKGAQVWNNDSGPWAAPLLRIGPDLVPQPGSLFRRTSVQRVGELRTDLGWAFDFDFFIRLSKVGRLSYLRETLAEFRWHSDSLSVGQRADSVREASVVRRSHLPAWLRPISVLWEGPVRWATFRASALVKKDDTHD
jgi:glycosyltransferase involved in cell wall biosynthesis